MEGVLAVIGDKGARQFAAPRPASWRKPAVLALAGASIAILASAPFDPARASHVPAMSASDAGELSRIGLAPLGDERVAPRAKPSAAVEPLTAAPVRSKAAARALTAATPTTITPVRIRGRVGDGLIAALEATPLATDTARAFLRTLAGRLDLSRDLGPDDHFDLVVASRSGPSGPYQGELLYAAVDRVGASDVRLMKWNLGGRMGWLDAAAAGQRPGATVSPVAGRVSSGFGLRNHPLLNFVRMHKGVDFAAGWGRPIVASADGVVSRAGWAGGYGRQVRIAHGGGMVSSYSHMSRTAVAPGRAVRAGEVIGYVGSSGLSTGPHLHYEVIRGGVPVNPLAARLVGPTTGLGSAELDRFRARYAKLLALRPLAPPQLALNSANRTGTL